MTTSTPERLAPPELGQVQGTYDGVSLPVHGGTSNGHVAWLLSQSTTARGKLRPDVIDKMRRHPQVASCLLVQSLPLIRADWTIECDDERIAETLTAWYRTIAFRTHRSLSKALSWGYTPNEVVWDYVPDLRGIYPTQVRDLPPRTCTAAVDEHGDLDGFQQRPTAGTATPTYFEPIYTLWVTEGMEDGNLYGRSLLTAALDPWSDSAAIRAFHARYLERFGEPVVIARAPAGKTTANFEEIQAAVEHNQRVGATNPDDPGFVAIPKPILVDNVDQAMHVAQNLRNHTAVAFPAKVLEASDGKATGSHAWALDYLEATAGGGQDFVTALDRYDRQIARAMFVPDLLSQTTDTGGGAYALGQSHKSVWSESVEGRLDDYSLQITEQLIDPARRLNFGDQSPPARLVFAPVADEQKARLWSFAETLAAGLPIDLRKIAEEAGLPVVDVDEQEQQEAEEVPPGQAATSAHDTGRVRLAADPVAGLPEWKIPQSYDPPAAYRRALNSREERVGFGRLEDALNTAERAALAALDEYLDGERERIERQLRAIVRKDTPAEVIAALGSLDFRGSTKVASAWRDLMVAVGDTAVALLAGELAAYADQLPNRNGPAARALFRSMADTTAERVVSQVVTETRLELLNAYTSGVTTQAGLSSIVAGIVADQQTSEGKAVRLTTRMLSAKAMNYSRATALEQSGIPLAGAQYSAVLDRRTCDLCEKLDERVIAIERSGDLSRFTPPIHHNCRCVWVWITRDEPDFTETWVTPSNSDVERYGGLVL